jgi:hypothetical protein
VRTRWLEVAALAVAALGFMAAGWAAATARWAPGGPCDDRGERLAWSQELCSTDAECAVLEVRLTELGWIPPEPMFSGDRRR